MILYFVNGSKQKKELLESDYADDVFDALIGFFEEHRKFPHILEAQEDGDDLKIVFESQSEYFLLCGASPEEKEEFRGYVSEA